MTGEWVILKGNDILERNEDIRIILKLAEKYNKEEITISKEPTSMYCFY